MGKLTDAEKFLLSFIALGTIVLAFSLQLIYLEGEDVCTKLESNEHIEIIAPVGYSAWVCDDQFVLRVDK